MSNYLRKKITKLTFRALTLRQSLLMVLIIISPLERFSNDCRKPKQKQLLQPITTEAGSAMKQSQFLAIICNSLKAREKSRVHGAIGFGFAFHWLKNWRESFKPITKRRNRNHVITFDSNLKTALSTCLIPNVLEKKNYIVFWKWPLIF